MLELVLTSAKNGLIPGRSGFCSVAWTEGMPQNLVTLLENMSGYNALYAPGDPMAIHNPVCYSYQKVQLGRSVLRVVSRIAFAGLDYTGRSNKIAHHIILDDEQEFQRMKHGPISLLLQESNFYTEWNEPPRLLPMRKKFEFSEGSRTFADNWQQIAGDARWAGHVADIFENYGDQRCVYLEYDHLQHGRNVLHMIDEITRLLPEEKAREFTFTTCFSSAQNGCSCFFRGALPNSAALPAIRRFKSQDLISVISGTPFPDNIPESRNIAKAQGKEFSDPVVQPVASAATPIIKLQRENISISPSIPASPLDSEISLNASTIRNYSVVTPEIRKKSFPIRLVIFLLAAFLLLAGIIGGISFFIFTNMKDKKSESVEKSDAVSNEKKSDSPEKPKSAPKPQKPAPKPQKPEKKKPDSSGTKKDPVKNSGTKKDSDSTGKKDTAGLPPLREPSDEELYKMLCDFMSNTENEVRIDLPHSLQGTQKITVTLKEKWFDTMGKIKISDYIEQRSNKKIIVYPLVGANFDQLKPDKSGKNLLQITLLDGTLSIRDGKNREEKHLPDRTHIVSITFHQGDENITWEIIFKKKFIEFIPHGEIDDDLKYIQTDEEKLFCKSGWININSGKLKKLKDVKEQMDKWNGLITEINKLQKDAAKIKFIKFEDLEKSHAEFIKACNAPTKDAKAIQKAFDTVRRQVVKLYADDEKKWLKKRKMNSLTIYIQDLINEWDTATNGKSKVSGTEAEKIAREKKLSDEYAVIIGNIKDHKNTLKRIKYSFDKFDLPARLTPDHKSVENWDINSKKPLKVLPFKYDEVVKYVRDNHDKYVERKLNSDNRKE